MMMDRFGAPYDNSSAAAAGGGYGGYGGYGSGAPPPDGGGGGGGGGGGASAMVMSPGGYGESPSKGRTSASAQSLTPVSIKQLLNANQPHQDDVFRVDNHEVYQLSIVGVVLSVAETSTNLMFKLDDGTGQIDVRLWLNSTTPEENENMARKREQWTIGSYVRIVGQLRSFLSQRSLVAFRITKIVDFNELTFHLLEAIYVHLYYTRGFPNQNQNRQSGFPTNTTGYEQHASSSSDGLSNVQVGVLDILQNTTEELGIHVQSIVNKLGYAKPHEVREAIQFFIENGQVYTTKDDDHVKSV